MATSGPDLKFLLYSINYSPELTGIGKYNGEMAEWLVKSGSKVDVICSQPHYPEWKVHKGYSKYLYRRRNENGVTVTRCPAYIPAHPQVIKRLLHLISFAITSSLSLFGKLFQKPDVVFVVQPTLFCTPLALIFSKLVGAKTVLHIQDFEIDAMFGLGMAKSSKLNLKSKIARCIEKFIMRRFDIVSSISHSMLAKAKDKGVDPDKLRYFPNWSNTEFVHPEVDGSEIRSEWGVSDDQKMVLYAGNIGAKQGLEVVLEAADQLQERNLKIFIVGEGAHGDRLKELSQSMGLTNVEFKGLLPWERVPNMLSAADVHLVTQRKGAADAVLPSKLTNILSAGGHAVVTAENGTELSTIANDYPGVYYCVEPESTEALVKGIDFQLGRAGDGSSNVIARNFAEKYVEVNSVLTRFKSDIFELFTGKESFVTGVRRV